MLAHDPPKRVAEAKYFQKAEPGTLGGNHTCIMSEASGLCGGPWTRYHMTKLANAAYAMKLHEELQARGSKVRRPSGILGVALQASRICRP